MTSKKIIAIASFLIAICLCLAAWERSAAARVSSGRAQSPALGEIAGQIRFQGTPPPLRQIHMSKDPVCAAAHTAPVYLEDEIVNGNGTLPNAFVYVKSSDEKLHFQVPSKPAVLDQVGCVYTPHVLGVMVGQELDVLSSDPTTHNVRIVAQNNREWNHSQPPGGAPLKKKFSNPEIMIAVECQQHPWMEAYIGVTSNPFFAVTGKDGDFVIQSVPPGEYTLAVWTATFGRQEQKVKVEAGQTARVDFVFKTP